MVGRYKNSLFFRACVVLAATGLTILIATSSQAGADTLTSPDYRLSPTVGDSFGGSFGSTDYKLTDSGGEAAIGNGAGGSYKLGAGYVAQLQHSINLYVEPAGLVAYYPMNEGAGPTVHDASGNSNDGTASNTTWTQGKIGDALSFNGSNSYVSTGYSNTGSSITTSAWAYTSNFDQNAIIVDEEPVNTEWQLMLGSGMVIWRGATGSNTVQCSLPSNSSWHLFTATQSGAKASIYIDGSLCGTNTAGTPIGTTGTGIQIGRYSSGGGGYYFNGVIDDVKIYNRALSADEVEANYQAGEAGFDSGLVIPPVQPGQSQTVDANVIVDADAPYSLLTRETGPLTDVNNSSNTIPSISGTIASPAAWVEGTTEGLGFTVTSGPNGVPAKWSSGTKYAAVPTTSTDFYDRTGFSGGLKDIIGLQYRLDVSGSQPASHYKTDMTYTATMTP